MRLIQDLTRAVVLCGASLVGGHAALADSWEVELVSGETDRTLLHLIDTVGPYNKWRALDPDAFLPSSGEFTNQLRKVVPVEPLIFILRDFDIDEVSEGDTGPGENNDDDGAFPTGSLEWRVVRELP